MSGDVAADRPADAERWGAIASSLAHVLCALPIGGIVAARLGREVAACAQRNELRLPALTEAFLQLGDPTIGGIGSAIAIAGFAAGWVGWRTSRMTVPVLLLAAQVWWTAAVLAAYALPLVKVVGVIGERPA